VAGDCPTDEDLLDRYANGDAQAFETFFHRHRGRVFHYTLKKVGRPEVASEISQDVFLKLHSKIHLYQTHQPALPWFFTMVHNACLDALRKRATASRAQEHLEQVQSQSPVEGSSLHAVPSDSDDKAGGTGAWNDLLSGAFEKLSKEQQDILKARVVDEKSFGTLSVESGKSEVALRKIYSRAIQKIRTLLRGTDESGGEK
jgi:RNA polymerase sigma factor (sigma-70 family)